MEGYISHLKCHEKPHYSREHGNAQTQTKLLFTNPTLFGCQFWPGCAPVNDKINERLYSVICVLLLSINPHEGNYNRCCIAFTFLLLCFFKPIIGQTVFSASPLFYGENAPIVTVSQFRCFVAYCYISLWNMVESLPVCYPPWRLTS